MIRMEPGKVSPDTSARQFGIPGSAGRKNPGDGAGIRHERPLGEDRRAIRGEAATEIARDPQHALRPLGTNSTAALVDRFDRLELRSNLAAPLPEIDGPGPGRKKVHFAPEPPEKRPSRPKPSSTLRVFSEEELEARLGRTVHLKDRKGERDVSLSANMQGSAHRIGRLQLHGYLDDLGRTTADRAGPKRLLTNLVQEKWYGSTTNDEFTKASRQIDIYFPRQTTA